MAYIEFEKSIRDVEWSMHRLHSHTHYEIYYLSKGSRSFYLANALMTVTAPAILVIPPHVLHKTEGGGFERYNVNVSPSYLDEYQREILNKTALSITRPTAQEAEAFKQLLEDAITIDRRKKHGEYVLRSLLTHAVFMINSFDVLASKPTKLTASVVPSTVLKVIRYLEEDFHEKITLDDLSHKFFIAKTTLIYNFNKYLSCSPMDFLLNIRLTKAKEMLTSSSDSIGKISEQCGFSSANYFGLIFKEKEGLSPLNYRKLQRNKY